MASIRKATTMLVSALVLSALVLVGGALGPAAPAAQAQSNSACGNSSTAIPYTKPNLKIGNGPLKGLYISPTIKPMVPVVSSSNASTDCMLKASPAAYRTGNGVRALQNALAFTDYDLKAGALRYEYAGLLVGSGALAANNWGIDGVFGQKTYDALKEFQKDKAVPGGADGEYGNYSRDALYFGGDDFAKVTTNGVTLYKYKLTVRTGLSSKPAQAVYGYNY